MLDTDALLKRFESDILSYLSIKFPTYYYKATLEHNKEYIKYVSSLFDEFNHIHEDREKVNPHLAYKNANEAFKFDELKKNSSIETCTIPVQF